MNPDLINGLFELFASVMVLNNCLRLYRDKCVMGVSIASTAFFFGWGVWNVYYYPAIGQPFSFYAGIAVCASNALWVAMMVFYSRVKTA